MFSTEAYIRSILMLFTEAYRRSLLERVRLNRAILTNKYWFLPVDDKGHEDFEPVGRGVPSSDFCGVWRGFSVCKNVEGHKGVVINGVDCSGGAVVRHKHWWCHKPTCVVCFNRGWAPREARSVLSRLDEGVRRGFGKVEHISVSVCPEDYNLPEKVFREKCRLALVDRGVIGGNMMFHGFRIDRVRNVLVWAPHYHTVGFIEGGFDRCRDCVHERGDCSSCSGFKGREVRGYAKDRIIVKVFDERKTVFGTAFYQLNHSTVRVGLKRFHTVTWFGVCGNRKYGSVKLMSEDVCPACGEEMTRHFYVGKRRIIKNVGDVDYKSWFVVYGSECDDFIEAVGGRVSKEYG